MYKLIISLYHRNISPLIKWIVYLHITEDQIPDHYIGTDLLYYVLNIVSFYIVFISVFFYFVLTLQIWNVFFNYTRKNLFYLSDYQLIILNKDSRFPVRFSTDSKHFYKGLSLNCFQFLSLYVISTSWAFSFLIFFHKKSVQFNWTLSFLYISFLNFINHT